VPRNIIVVDVETNGLNIARHQAVEVAWWNLTTDARGWFVPPHNVSEILGKADLKALQVNRYVDRIAEREQDSDGDGLTTLHNQFSVYDEDLATFTQHTLAGSNPRLDAAMVNKLFAGSEFLEIDPWHYRLLDVGAYAMGALGLGEVPGLWDVCQALGIPPGDHSAEADVTATGLCLRALMKSAKGGAE
jgi:hypothetical protein